MFRGVFEEEIAARVGRLPWVETVSVRFAPAEAEWDETRLSPAARAALGRGAQRQARL
jgi:hypothetical protein